MIPNVAVFRSMFWWRQTSEKSIATRWKLRRYRRTINPYSSVHPLHQFYQTENMMNWIFFYARLSDIWYRNKKENCLIKSSVNARDDLKEWKKLNIKAPWSRFFSFPTADCFFIEWNSKPETFSNHLLIKPNWKVEFDVQRFWRPEKSDCLTFLIHWTKSG